MNRYRYIIYRDGGPSIGVAELTTAEYRQYCRALGERIRMRLGELAAISPLVRLDDRDRRIDRSDSTLVYLY